MPDFLAPLVAAATAEGIWFLIIGLTLGGVVRGFSGFGTAMIYMPFAAQVLSPFEALTSLVVVDMIGPAPLIPQMIRQCHGRDVLRLGGGLALALPVGLWTLTLVAPEVFRYVISGTSFILLLLLVGGVRYAGELKKGLIWLAGAVGGFLAGVAGVPGPPVILLYMASPLSAATIRANVFLYLIIADVLMLTVMALFGELVASAVWTGILFAPVYLLANMAGAAIFRPENEMAYRALAYIVIAGAALSGLPLWD